MPSLIHHALAALADLAGRRTRPSDDIGMAAELSAAQLRPPGFAPPRGLDRHVSLRVSRQHGWRVYEMAPWGAGLPVDRLVYFHGGGYVGEINSSHWAVCRRMSRLVPARVHVPIYPVAPDATAETTVAVSADIVADIVREPSGSPCWETRPAAVWPLRSRRRCATGGLAHRGSSSSPRGLTPR